MGTGNHMHEIPRINLTSNKFEEKSLCPVRAFSDTVSHGDLDINANNGVRTVPCVETYGKINGWCNPQRQNKK